MVHGKASKTMQILILHLIQAVVRSFRYKVLRYFEGKRCRHVASRSSYQKLLITESLFIRIPQLT